MYSFIVGQSFVWSDVTDSISYITFDAPKIIPRSPNLLYCIAMDKRVADILAKERRRQDEKLSMIPSENFFSKSVRSAVGSEFMHKYSEGNIGARYYEGCEYIDELEQLTIDRAKEAFSLPDNWTANVQALSGSNANLAVYLALLEQGDTILSMYLPDGGHLSHGWSYEPKTSEDPQKMVYEGGSRKVNIVSRMFNVVQYKTDPKTQLFDYDSIQELAEQRKPKLLISGGTAYPQLIDHQRMRAIADSVGAYYLADIAHEAGLIAAGVIPSPVGIADAVTMTTHKTLRSGRGAIILAREELIKKINRAVLPGLQGGPHNHNIAGICVGLGEVNTPAYKEYAQSVVDNAIALAKELSEKGFQIVSGGVAKHLILIDLTQQPLLGKKFSKALDVAGIVANYNTMPAESRSPADPSAVRLGTPWITSRGMGKTEMSVIASYIAEVMGIAAELDDDDFSIYNQRVSSSKPLLAIAEKVKELCSKFPNE